MKQPTSMYPDVCCVLCTSFQQNCHVTGDASFNVAVAQEWKSDGQVVWPHCGNFAPLTETRELKRFRSHTWRRPVVQRPRRPRFFLRCGTCTPTIYNWIAASGRSSWSTTGLCFRSTLGRDWEVLFCFVLPRPGQARSLVLAVVDHRKSNWGRPIARCQSSVKADCALPFLLRWFRHPGETTWIRIRAAQQGVQWLMASVANCSLMLTFWAGSAIISCGASEIFFVMTVLVPLSYIVHVSWNYAESISKLAQYSAQTFDGTTLLPSEFHCIQWAMQNAYWSDCGKGMSRCVGLPWNVLLAYSTHLSDSFSRSFVDDEAIKKERSDTWGMETSNFDGLYSTGKRCRLRRWQD